MSALPDWLTQLPDAKVMRGLDRWAIEEQGIDGLDLMERAGAGVARAVERIAPDGPVTIVCGKGNNGGDGLVAARLLRDAGRRVTVVCIAPPAQLLGDARANLERLPEQSPVRLDGSHWDGPQEDSQGGESEHARSGPFESAAVIVDALLGTGFQGEPRGGAAEAIDLINDAGVPVVSVDVPSGVDASTGVVAGRAVHATLTISFHAGKPGLWIRPGKDHAGRVERLDIGIPRGAPATASIGLIEPSILELLPRRLPTGTKFASGFVLVAGGSRGLTGAPAMTARASMRTGAGYVTVCVPATLQPVLAGAGTPEVMSAGLADDGEGSLTEEAVADVLAATRTGGALALGPGLGRRDGAVAFARRLASEAEVAVVIDADGLNAHAGRLEDLAERRHPTVLTPHAGELGRLLDLDSAEVERERLRHACDAAEQARAVVVLKGDDTIIAAPGGPVAVSPGGSPALATAGTGDVLTGVIAALLAQQLDPLVAAAAGVWLHAEAGRQAAAAVGVAEAVMASDVIEALPAARLAGPPGDRRRGDGALEDG